MDDPNYSSPHPNLPPPRPRDYNGTMILVLGICGITVCGCCAPFAWSMGATALQRMDNDQVYDGNERTFANVGRILGIIGTVLILLSLLAFFVGLGSHRR